MRFVLIFVLFAVVATVFAQCPGDVNCGASMFSLLESADGLDLVRYEHVSGNLTTMGKVGLQVPKGGIQSWNYNFDDAVYSTILMDPKTQKLRAWSFNLKIAEPILGEEDLLIAPLHYQYDMTTQSMYAVVFVSGSLQVRSVVAGQLFAHGIIASFICF